MKKYFEGRFLLFLIALMGLMVLSPMLEGFIGISIVMDCFITIIFAGDPHPKAVHAEVEKSGFLECFFLYSACGQP
jgi:hypothetical protein